MNIVADLQLHSKYSRAVSKYMDLESMAEWGEKKGIDLLATGDWMHPEWFKEIKFKLEEDNEGIYRLRNKKQETRNKRGVRFLLSAEISCIYTQGGKGRRVHTLVFAPSLGVAEKINKELAGRGCNLESDGRPIVGLSCKQVAEVVFEASGKCLIIPAHCWTPWFALYGSKSGFDSIEECYGNWAKKIFAVETGLSSDPLMNWRVGDLERRALLSFSDAHSMQKIGREATVFQSKNRISNSQFSIFNYDYSDIYWAIGERFLGKNQGRLEIGYTIEFYPQEGKYHWDGHRKCGVVQSPQESEDIGVMCKVCGKRLTIGVEYRVRQLSDPANRSKKSITRVNKKGVAFNYHPTDKTRPGYVMLVPLLEILSQVHGAGVGSKRVNGEYERLIKEFGSEFEVLLEIGQKELVRVGGERLARGIEKVRNRKISVSEGFDGEFGKVKIFETVGKKEENGQGRLFS